MLSPSYFSLILIYGIGIAIALTYQMSIPWHRNITIIIYIIPAIWLLFNYFKKRNLKIELIEIFISLFIFIILISQFIYAGIDSHSYDIKNFFLLLLLEQIKLLLIPTGLAITGIPCEKY